MADDASKPKPERKAQPKRAARPRPDRNAFEAGRDAMDRHPIVMARLAE
ncbi:hypothetical protein [Caulobacter sp. S45]|nr:hypothetical protein [Caulobacter sp. S45]